MFDFYPYLRSLLFSLDPECTHDQVLRLLSAFPGVMPHHQIDAPVQCMGLSFPNRLGLAAGLDKNAVAVPAWERLGFGFIEVGTVTPQAQPGNEKPRLFRLSEEQALINRMGFNNNGITQLIAQLQLNPAKRAKIGINLGKNKTTPNEEAIEDYLSGMEQAYAIADYLTINISSPNTEHLRELQQSDSLQQLLQAINAKRRELQEQHRLYTPVVVKIAPDIEQDEIESISDILLKNHIDGLIATNTSIQKDLLKQPCSLSGGISGAPLKERSTAVLRAFAERLSGRLTLIASGGVMSVEDCRQKLDAGADLVQIYSGFIYHGPRLIRDCLLMLSEEESKH